MFPLLGAGESRRVVICSLITCFYLSSIITVVSYNGLLYSVGKGSSFYILVLIFVAELLKSFYLNTENDIHAKKSKQTESRDFVKSFIFLIAVVVCFFIGIIFFGAPVLDNHEETLMLSVLLTLLTTFPLCAHVGFHKCMPTMFGIKNYRRESIQEMLVRNAWLAVCGAWLGAVVIPLDWNTQWQVWPIPCYLGAIGGYLLSNILTVIIVILVAAAHKYPSLNFLDNIAIRLSVANQFAGKFEC